jgi:hypothetical protein
LEKRARLPGQLWEDDCITTMNDIANITKTKFVKYGICTVLDMKQLIPEQISVVLGEKEFLVSEQKLKKWQEAAEQANTGSVPSRVSMDHRKEANPYLSRYGPTWKDEIRKCSAMVGCICVTKMAWYMKDETDWVMKGTKYEGKSHFYHDALTLMTCTKMKAYMNKHNLRRYWLLPQENLQEGTRYQNSIPGDSPELMPLDETLNMDIHVSARYHVAITSHLQNDNPLKFLFSTPKEISREYLRIVNPDTGGGLHHLGESFKTVTNGSEVWKR